MSRVSAPWSARAKPQAWRSMWGWASRGREAATLYFRKSKLITSGTPTNVSLKGAFDPYLRAPTQESFWSIAVAPRRLYFSGMAGKRLSVWVAGSTVIPADSSAVTPNSGSTLSGPKITLPAVISPIKVISTSPNGYSCLVPTGSTPILLSSRAGAHRVRGAGVDQEVGLVRSVEGSNTLHGYGQVC